MLCCFVIEIREHISCANVFLKFPKNINITGSMKVSVHSDTIRLQNQSNLEEICLKEYFKIITNTFSSLFIEENNISFRINIENICLDKHLPFDEKLLNIKPNIIEGQPTDFYCSNCENILCSQNHFHKIRAYPSCLINFNDFFCHQATNFNELLEPETHDLFYGLSFIILHKVCLKTNVKVKEEHIYCQRCLTLLGEKVPTSNAIKLWSEAVTIKNASTESSKIFTICGASETQLLLHKMLRECLPPSAEPLQQRKHFIKVALQASFPNRKCKYLLIHIIENQLLVLRNGKACNHRDKSNINATNDLKPYHAFKLLYKYISGDEDTDSFLDSKLSLLPEWQKDASVNMRISPYLFCNLLDELRNNMYLASSSHRQFGDFYSSYIFY